jgi:Mrp family chromosome partitioning ATPase
MQKRDELAIVVEPKQAAAETFRLLQATSTRALERGEVRTILVTSAVQKEGKSTTAASLAVAGSLRQAGRVGRPRPPAPISIASPLAGGRG